MLICQIFTDGTTEADAGGFSPRIMVQDGLVAYEMRRWFNNTVSNVALTRSIDAAEDPFNRAIFDVAVLPDPGITTLYLRVD